MNPGFRFRGSRNVKHHSVVIRILTAIPSAGRGTVLAG